MKNEPLVSVIIPTYNRREWLKEAVVSVLNQSYTNYEIIVVDDGSTESIEDIPELKNEKIRLYRNDNHGVAYSRNYGMKKAIGYYIAFLDSDDFWTKDKLQIQVNAMQQTGAVWSQHNYFYYSDEKKRTTKKINTYVYSLKEKKAQFSSFKVQTSCFMIDRMVALENGCFFDESKEYGEDSEFYYKFAKIDDLLCIDEYLGYFRIRDKNTGMDIIKQIHARNNFYLQHHKERFYSENCGRLSKFAYIVCCALYNVGNIGRIGNGLSKILYVIPWMLFKLDSIYLIMKK